MKNMYIKLFMFLVLSSLVNQIYSQTSIENETVYALNVGATTKDVAEDRAIIWSNKKPFPEGSYIKIKNKGNGNYYIQTIVGGQFAYGHYFKYLSDYKGIFNYKRTDGEDMEFLSVNFPLSELAASNQHDQKVRMELVNYRTSFAMLFLF